jgi:amidase
MIPFSPNIQTVYFESFNQKPGFFTRDLNVMKQVSELFFEKDMNYSPTKILIPTDAFEIIENEEIRNILLNSIEKIDKKYERIEMKVEGMKDAFQHTNTIIGYEAWNNHKEWIQKDSPKFSSVITKRWEVASNIKKEDYEKSIQFQKDWMKKMDNLLEDAVMVVPTTSGPAFLRDEKDTEKTGKFAFQTLTLNSISGQGGLPQLNIPGLIYDGKCIGISVISKQGTDLNLIEFAQHIKL